MTTTASSILQKLLLLFLIFAGLYYAKGFLIPVAIGGVLATLFLPLSRWLESKKVPKGLAVLSCLIVILLIMTGIALLLSWQVTNLTNDFSLIKEIVMEKIDHIQEFILYNFNISVKNQTQVIKEQQPFVSGIIKSIVGSLTKIGGNFVLILAYIFCMIYYRSHIKEFLIKLASPTQRNQMENIVYGTARVSQQYLLGLSKMIVCLWILYAVGFSILGVKNALFFAVLCGLLEIVPFIGNITGTSLTLLVSAVNDASLPMLTGIAVTYGVIQLFQGWILEPIIVGPQVKINPLSTIIALVIGQIVWGIPGIFLAIPLIAMVKIVCDHVDFLKPYGFLIGEIETEKKESSFIKRIKNRIFKLAD